MNTSRIVQCILLFLVMILAGVCETQCAGLRAGTAEVEITAPVGYPMAGYGARKDVSTGVHDPLFARVLVLKTEQTSVALVSLDMALFFSNRVFTEAKEKYGIDHVIVSCTHTHSGAMPKVSGIFDFESFLKDPWYRRTEDTIIAAIGKASLNLFDARAGAGRGSVYLGHNRRQVNEDGSVTMLWRNTERKPTNPVDPTVRVVRIDDEGGNPRALLVNYACHAVVMGPDNLEFSADYPGYMAAYIKKELGEDCMPLFLQGAAGDINPYHDKEPLTEKGFKAAEEAGVALGEEAVKAARRIRMTEKPVSLKVSEKVLRFSHRYDPEKSSEAGMITVLVNDDIALCGIPGEPFVQHQIDLYRRSQIDNTLFLGYIYAGKGSPFVGYLPTIRAAIEGGYGASYATLLEVGAGERLVDQAVITIYELLGMLPDVPADVR